MLLTLLMTGDQARLSKGGVFSEIAIEGNYRIDDGSWQPLSKDTDFDLDQNYEIYIKGYFTKDIPPNLQLMLRITDLRVQLKVNGKLIYTFGEEGRRHPLTRTGGNVWHNFTSPGISTTDEVEIVLANVYRVAHPATFRVFLDEMYYGSLEGLYAKMLEENGMLYLIGIFFLSAGIILLIVAIECTLVKYENVFRIFVGAGFLISSGLWFCIDFNLISLIMPYPAFIGTLDILTMYFIGTFFNTHIVSYTTKWRKILGLLAVCGNLLLIKSSVLLQLFGVLDAYDTPPIGSVIMIISIFLCVCSLFLECLVQKKKSLQYLLVSIAPIVIGSVLDAISYWLSTANETMWIRLGFAVFVLIQSIFITLEIKRTFNRAEEAQHLEKELMENRIAMMMSQIQPHFLYNSLTAIYQLCDIDPKQAKKAVLEFSNYLRGNLDSLAVTEKIAFEQELQHVNTYLSLEEMRLGDELTIVRDIEVSDFRLPVLTVQPLVENAVRYGISKKDGGGTLTIATRETKHQIYITVTDDGVGFDTTVTKQDNRSHIGIENVSKRIATECGGTLAVSSLIGKGTVATIIIPKEHDRDACNRS